MYSEWVNPVQLMPRDDGGGLPALAGTGTNLPVLDMPQTSAALTSFRRHLDWRSGVLTFKLHYAPEVTDADPFSIRFVLDSIKNGETLTAVPSNRAIATYNVPGGTANTKLTFEPNASGSSFAIFSSAMDTQWDWIAFRIVRLTDSNGGDIRIIGVEFFYTEVNRYIG